MDALNDTAEVDEAPEATAAASKPAGKPRAPKPKLKPKIKLQAPAKTQSTIGFPYRDLETAISVVQTMMGAGGVALKTDQLAGVMGLQQGSGNFIVRTLTARMFGLMTYSGGMYELTDLGFNIVDKNETRQRQARAAAFLTVPLFKRAYEEFKGRPLPPRPLGLEQAFVRFGVTVKAKEAARQVFDKSAQQAGFFAAGPDRLIEPIISGGGGLPPRQPVDDGGNGNNPTPPQSIPSDGPDVSGFHPFVQGLLDTLPEPNTNWAIEGRAKWLQAAANIFDLIYKGSGDITITAKVQPEKQ
jgi:hypothetical protein